MAGTIAVGVRSALMTALATAVNATGGMADVYVSFQHPSGDPEPREIVWSQNAQIDLKSVALRAGRNFLDETTTFDVVLWAWAPNQTAAVAAARVVAIGEVVAAWIGDHKNGETLSVTGLKTLTVSGSGTQTETTYNNSVAGRLQIPVKFTARLT